MTIKYNVHGPRLRGDDDETWSARTVSTITVIPANAGIQARRPKIVATHHRHPSESWDPC
jgi:hypothetical protein